jgi:mono/diheme cytochrome c family protein
MGGPETSLDQDRALKHYLDSMRAPAISTQPDSASVARGAALFASEQTGCTGCHNGPRLSNDAVIDVGTGDGPMKVPALHELATHAPYLHNGCATTLADRFGPCGGDAHGSTAGLDASDIQDLVSYLSTL